jgi:hypothetical protein
VTRRGASGDDAPAAFVPVPEAGDAGKAITVNEAEDGYELAQSGASVADSRLNLTFTDGMALAAGVASAVPWTVADSAGADLSLLEDTLNVLVATAGTYLVRVMGAVSNNHATDELTLHPGATGTVGGDSQSNSFFVGHQASGDPNQYSAMWVWRVPAGAHIACDMAASGGSADETLYAAAMDIVRIA